MPYRANYPQSVAEILDDSMTFQPAALKAVRQLAKARPWRVNGQARLNLFTRCLAELCIAYNLPLPRLSIGAIDCYLPAFNQIQLTEQLSVVTFLHEFAHVRGFDERQACRWSVNLFRRCFPRSFANCRQVGHMLMARSEVQS